MPANPSSALFERVVALSGLADVFAADSVERVCMKAGVSIQALAPADLPKVVPHLKPVLKLFLGAAEADRRIAQIEALASR